MLTFGRGDGPAFRWLRNSSFPVYVLHSPAIVLVGHFAVRTDWSIPVKFGVTLAGSLVLTLLVYELVVGNTGDTRIFGGPTDDAKPARTKENARSR